MYRNNSENGKKMYQEPTDFQVKNTDADKKRFIEEYQNCKTSVIEDIKSMDTIKTEAFDELLAEEPGTEGKLEAISCILNAWKTDIDNIKVLITEIDKLASGQFGQVYKVLNGREISFLVKKDINGHNNVIHEAFSGMYVINKLRHKCPNFIYTYSTFFCEDLANVTVKEWCDRNGETPYLLIENIPNATDLMNFVCEVDDIDSDQVFCVILQILSALNYAATICNFTHYDLHDSNVLVQKLDTETLVPIFLSGNETPDYYLRTKYLARIIDYGMVYFEQNQTKYFKKNAEDEVETYPIHYPARDMCSIFNTLYSDYDCILQKETGTREYREIYPMILENVYFRVLERSLENDRKYFGKVLQNSPMYSNGYLKFFENYSHVTNRQIMNEYYAEVKNIVSPYLLNVDIAKKDIQENTSLCTNSECKNWLYYREILFDQDPNNNFLDEEIPEETEEVSEQIAEEVVEQIAEEIAEQTEQIEEEEKKDNNTFTYEFEKAVLEDKSIVENNKRYYGNLEKANFFEIIKQFQTPEKLLEKYEVKTVKFDNEKKTQKLFHKTFVDISYLNDLRLENQKPFFLNTFCLRETENSLTAVSEKPGKLLSEFLSGKTDISSYKIIILQIFSALAYTNRKISYTHYNLTADKISLFSNTAKDIKIYNNEENYVKSSKISIGIKNSYTSFLKDGKEIYYYKTKNNYESDFPAQDFITLMKSCYDISMDNKKEDTASSFQMFCNIVLEDINLSEWKPKQLLNYEKYNSITYDNITKLLIDNFYSVTK